MRSRQARLLNSGLLNQVEGDLAQIVSAKKYTSEGYCDSEQCTTVKVPYTTPTGLPGIKTKKRSKKYITSNTSVDVCPHCGSYLRWKRRRVHAERQGA